MVWRYCFSAFTGSPAESAAFAASNLPVRAWPGLSARAVPDQRTKEASRAAHRRRRFQRCETRQDCCVSIIAEREMVTDIRGDQRPPLGAAAPGGGKGFVSRIPAPSTIV